jgi:hypothetical protein
MAELHSTVTESDGDVLVARNVTVRLGGMTAVSKASNVLTGARLAASSVPTGQTRRPSLARSPTRRLRQRKQPVPGLQGGEHPGGPRLARPQPVHRHPWPAEVSPPRDIAKRKPKCLNALSVNLSDGITAQGLWPNITSLHLRAWPMVANLSSEDRAQHEPL